MVETAVVIGIVLMAAAGLFWSFQRSVTGNKTMCSCGKRCSSADTTCSGQDLVGGPNCCDEAFDEAKSDASSSGKIPRGHF